MEFLPSEREKTVNDENLNVNNINNFDFSFIMQNVTNCEQTYTDVKIIEYMSHFVTIYRFICKCDKSYRDLQCYC